jgi:hypothetical protein
MAGGWAMAVEDHPLWPKWKAALERFISARDNYKAIKNFGPNNSELRMARAEYEDALEAVYHAIAKEE